MTDRVPSIDVVGVDMSHTMTLVARAFRTIEPAKDHVSFVRADATRLDFPDASFDAVTGHSFLYLVPRPDLILAEARRVLRPGGRVVFLEPSVETFPALLPPAIWKMGPRAPRFTLAMALWRIYSRGHGRFDEARFQRLFEGAGLSFLACREAVSGLGLYGIATRDDERCDERRAAA
jgi:SAM-dependent methyltransferase